MVRKVTPSQLQSMLRQAEQKRKQAIDKYNREVNAYNQKRQQEINRLNQNIRQHNQKQQQAINAYNQEVQRHNARVRANRQKIASELRRLQTSTTTIRYQTIRTSAIALNSSYELLDARGQDFESLAGGTSFLDLSERENANSLEVSNELEASADNEVAKIDPSLLLRTEISSMLQTISPELNSRWKGALFSLNPENPDAARHFCTSAREVFVQILDINAPDSVVLSQNPSCEVTDKGQPTRREKIRYLLARSGLLSDASVDFVDEDVKNVLSLFRVFNDGTHGSAGTFSIGMLLSIKTRVENGISYLASISSNA
jgi:hypothetical protein